MINPSQVARHIHSAWHHCFLWIDKVGSPKIL